LGASETHTHQDHAYGLLSPDGRVLFPNLKTIIIAEAAMHSFLAERRLARFRPLLVSIEDGDQVAGRLRAVALPGHARDHMG
jgi:glyoxylase-like metal-dependent hydrolase (beta-lactamase superfamily II)